EAERYDLKLCDLRFDKIDDIAEADLFGFSGINQDYEAIVEAEAHLRKRFPHATYIIGGPIAWSLNQAGEAEKLSMFDYVFVGDGEEAFPNFITMFAHRRTLPKVIETKQRFDVAKTRGFIVPSCTRPTHAIMVQCWKCPGGAHFCASSVTFAFSPTTIDRTICRLI